MIKRKKRKKKKTIKKPKLPANETFWLTISKNANDISSFNNNGNTRQKKELKMIINYRLWQIQEGIIDKNFFKNHDIDLKNINMKIPIKPKIQQPNKIIDLFDFSNIDLKEKSND